MAISDSQEKAPPHSKMGSSAENAPAAQPRAKNPNRVLAGRRNRAMRKGITPAGRERLRQAAFRVRPWERATGPRTAEGKARSAQNRRSRKKAIDAYRELRNAVRALIAPSMEMRQCVRKFLAESGRETPAS